LIQYNLVSYEKVAKVRVSGNNGYTKLCRGITRSRNYTNCG